MKYLGRTLLRSVSSCLKLFTQYNKLYRYRFQLSDCTTNQRKAREIITEDEVKTNDALFKVSN